MSRATICENCERLYVSYRGLIDLLDMDNIHCRKDGRLDVVPIEQCTYCDEATWENTGNPAQDWEYYNGSQEEIYESEIREECQYSDCGEQESYMHNLPFIGTFGFSGRPNGKLWFR